MKIKLNDWTITDDALKAATWVEIESGNDTTWTYDDSDRQAPVIKAQQSDDECWWDGIEADDVAALDAQGKRCKIKLSLVASDDETSQIWINDTEECDCAIAGDRDESLRAYQLAEMAGHEIGGRMRLDYEQAADKFLRDHEDWLFVMDNAREFANEWTLFACRDKSEVEEIERLHGDTTRYAAEDARTWIVAALESREDYRANHAADKCCSMMYATDDPNYGVPAND